MAAIEYVTIPHRNEIVNSIFNRVQEEYGFVPNILKAIANCPELLESFVPFWSGIYLSSYLPERYRALAALGTANTHGCDYCVAHMSESALKAGLLDDEILSTNVNSNYPNVLNEKESLIVRYASVLTENSGGVKDELLSDMKSHFSDSELVNLTLIIGLYNLTGRFLKALKIDVEPTFTLVKNANSLS
jgi:uncharacterized peroxidase-related enzyme